MEELSKFFTNATIAGIIKVVVVVVVGLFTAKILGNIIEKSVTERFDPQKGNIARKLATYFILLAVLIVVLSTFGIGLTGLLAAIGLFTVAIGFAAQTSVSNVISGLFLQMERPFEVDDIIEVEGTAGVILSVDLLSTKLRTFDNLFIRIPNETLLKSTIKTISKYETRRIDIDFGIAYKENIAHSKEVITSFVQSHPLVLKDPEPLVFTLSLGDSSVNLKARVWINRNDYISAIDQLTEGVKNALDDAGIEIPFPHLSLYFGEKPEFSISGNGG